MRVLLLTAPMTQLNGAFPATAYLLPWLQRRGHEVRQDDLSIRLALQLFSSAGVARMAAHAGLDLSVHVAVADRVLAFLQGRDPSLAYRIVGRSFLPEGPRFRAVDDLAGDDGSGLAWAFGTLGLQDRARWLSTLFVADLADTVRDHVDPQFELVRYGEQLAASAASFDPLAKALAAPPNLVTATLDGLVETWINAWRPEVVGVSAPFAGNAYGAFRIAQAVKRLDPEIRTVLGGGWPNTELRDLDDARVFDAFDHITLDDGETPLARLLEGGARVRTFSRQAGRVVFEDDGKATEPSFDQRPAPSWEGLPLNDYLGVLDTLNPMHRVWSDTRWNKLTVAHGCYWKKCSFCDLSLDYIARYDPARASTLVDWMEAQVAQTGQTGFHLVDEAAPPRVLEAMAREILARGLVVTWWGNLRFEKAFTPELCALMASSGCVAVTGGLEVGHDRLLERMQKGVTIDQVARVTRAFADAGIMVHAYLMYGFPTQTTQDTVDALEIVRQLFEEGCLVSAFWHRFTATVHSPVGRDPEAFGIRLVPPALVGPRFARNDVPFIDPTDADHRALGKGLEKALFNYMLGIGLDREAHTWLGRRAPITTVAPDRVALALAVPPPSAPPG